MKQEIKDRIEQINNGIVPEGYRSTSIGVLPEDWNVKKLKDVAEEITERAGTNKYETLSISAGIGFVNQAKKFGKELSGKQYEKYTVLKKGDFSYNKGNSKKYPQGCIYMLKDRECAAVPNVFESFRFNSDYSGYYEQLFILGFHNKQLYAKINHGVRDDGLLNLNGKDFYSINLPQPPLKVQKKIAEILSTQDKVIELKEKLIEQVHLQMKFLMQQLCTTDKHCINCKLGECIMEVDERTTENNQYDILSVTKDGIKKQSDHFNHQIASADNTNYKIIKKNQLALSILNLWMGSLDVLKTCDVGIISPAYKVFDFNSNLMLPDFGKYFLRSYNMIWLYNMNSETGASVVRKNLDLNSLLNSLITIPKIDEQRKIATILTKKGREILLLEQELEQEKQKKKALMQLLLTGIVRIK